MNEPTAIEKEAGKIVEGACASLEACPCGCNREATAGLFAEMPDEELLFDVADLFKAFSDTTRIKILFALMGGGLSVGDITAVVGCTQSAVSHQRKRAEGGHGHEEVLVQRVSVNESAQGAGDDVVAGDEVGDEEQRELGVHVAGGAEGGAQDAGLGRHLDDDEQHERDDDAGEEFLLLRVHGES